MEPTRRELLKGAGAIVSAVGINFVDAFLNKIVAQGITKKNWEGFIENVNKEGEEPKKRIAKELNNRIDSVQAQILKDYGINIDLLRIPGITKRVTQLEDGQKAFIDRIENLTEKFVAVKQVEKNLQKYPKDKDIFKKYIEEVVIGTNLHLPENNITRPAGLVDRGNKRMFLKVRFEFLLGTDNKVFQDNVFDHELLHLIAKDVTLKQWSDATYPTGKPNMDYMPLREYGKHKPFGFATHYGTQSFDEDIATVGDLLFGHFTIPFGMTKDNYKEEVRKDMILQNKINFVKNLYFERFNLSEGFWETFGAKDIINKG